MKKIQLLIIGAILVALSACSSSKDVVSHGVFQKRKHLSGWHFAGFTHKTSTQKIISAQEVENFDSESITVVASETIEPKNHLEKEFPAETTSSDNTIEIKDLSTLKRINLFEKIRHASSEATSEPLDGIAPDEPEEDVDVMVVVSFGLMLLTLSLGIIPVLGFLLSLAALIAAIIGLKHSKEKPLGILAFVLALILLALALGYNIFIFSAIFFL